jgi:hypothetical protein
MPDRHKVSALSFAWAYVANVYIIIVFCHFCLLPAYFYDKIVYVRNFERHTQIAGRFLPWYVMNGTEDFVLQTLHFQNRAVRHKL